jgi:hypothetical protein
VYLNSTLLGIQNWQALQKIITHLPKPSLKKHVVISFFIIMTGYHGSFLQKYNAWFFLLKKEKESDKKSGMGDKSNPNYIEEIVS